MLWQQLPGHHYGTVPLCQLLGQCLAFIFESPLFTWLMYVVRAMGTLANRLSVPMATKQALLGCYSISKYWGNFFFSLVCVCMCVFLKCCCL